MTELTGYPPGAARVVRAVGSDPYRLVPATNLLAKLKWRVAGTPVLGRPLWGPVSSEVLSAWERGVASLGCADRDVAGWLGQPGPQQCLTLAPTRVSVHAQSALRVAKVSVGTEAMEQIRREADVLAYASTFGFRHAPRAMFDAANEALLLEHIDGRHPSWDDSDIHAWLATLNPGGFEFVHGDVTPWNLLRTVDNIVLLDWEHAILGTTAPNVYNVLDFILRGSISARASSRRVRFSLQSLVKSRVVARSELQAALAGYEAYRHSVRPEHDLWLEQSVRLARDLAKGL